MKIFNTILLSLAFPLLSQAGTLLYPTAQLKSASFHSLEDVKSLGINFNSSEFVLKATKKSLLGTHLHYQQMVQGHEVIGRHIVVSINPKGQILKIYHSLSQANSKTLPSGLPFLSETMAIETVWNKLQANGRLLAKPVVSLIYDENMNLVYKVSLSLSSPQGHFEALVNAHNGEVLSVKDAALPRMKRAMAIVRTNQKPLFASYAAALRSFELQKRPELFKGMILDSGTAQVFDPNPTVTLGRTDLQDDTDPSVFLPAYKTEDLKEITLADGVYHLTGSKVTLLDFEDPTVDPVTSKDGHWIYERGHSGFTDAMTYLHIDRSIRSMEAIGYSGAHAIFNHVMEVDSDGVNGDDNSHYIPYTKRLAFGHGCVDDNEDSDVILHELGHAIQDHINPDWYGGDTGAMGEGFGDYWASSYSVTTEHGMEGNVNWVYKFDGHNDCWPGRKLDSFTPKYDPDSTYTAHAEVNGGITDELWSTPIFQAFLELYKRGVSKADLDKIILESHFGLGGGLTMPQMAESIVKTAKALFPDKDYDQVYLKHFKNMNML